MVNIFVILISLATYSCTNTPHELQQMLQELAENSENKGLKRNKLKTTVMPIYISTTLRSRTLKTTSTWERDATPETKTKKGDSKKNHGWMNNIRQTPRHLQG